MVPIGWLLIMLAIAAVIDGYHGKALWSSLNTYLQQNGNQATKKASA